jgi:hypothetical protein
VGDVHAGRRRRPLHDAEHRLLADALGYLDVVIIRSALDHRTPPPVLDVTSTGRSNSRRTAKSTA